jgi:hypothetical protein
MKDLNKRIERLERENPSDELTGFDIIIVDTKEQVDHPERFNKILDSEDVSETGFTTKRYHYERKEPSKT